MILTVAIIIIAVVSIGYSYYTVRQDIKKGKYTEKVTGELQKGRVIYYGEAKKDDQA